MPDRRAFLSLCLTVAAVSAVHAETPRSTLIPTRPTTAIGRAEPTSRTSTTTWTSVIVLYQTAMGVGLVRYPILISPPAEILGIQDGPDGVDPLGIKGIAPKQKDEQDPPTLP